MPIHSKAVEAGSPGITALLRGELECLREWVCTGYAGRLAHEITVIVIGSGCYGAAMGWWRSPEQALFVAIKFPVIILLTTLGNALLNAMLAPLLGLNITLRYSLRAVLMSFVISSAIMGAFSPLITFLTWNAPVMSLGAGSRLTYSFILLAHVTVIALAGIVGNLRLFHLLQHSAGRRAVAQRVLFAWLAGNLFLGSQLSWILRPFIGSPELPVEFLRSTAWHGSFFEAVFHSVRQILHFN